MPTSPLSSAEEARKAIAKRLGEIRRDAELTGLELARRCGWNPSKSSRIENARTPPSDADIRLWCAACGVPNRAADLIAASRTADSMYTEWRRLHRSGMRRNQEADVPIYERTRSFRVYCSNVVPGVVQTHAYATALLRLITEFQGTPDDSVDAAAARVERGRVIREPHRRTALLVEEQVLYHRYGDAETMAGQLGYLLTVMALPNVSLGVVPRTAQRRMWGLETFTVFGEELVQVEPLTARIHITSPSEVGTYTRAFAELSKTAVFGARARALITAAIEALG